MSVNPAPPSSHGNEVVPCAILAILIHPSTSHNIFNRICWAFCVYLEAVSVLPQLRLMQNTQIVEPFTAHYVFALGIARFLSCAHWILQLLFNRESFMKTKPMKEHVIAGWAAKVNAWS